MPHEPRTDPRHVQTPEKDAPATRSEPGSQDKGPGETRPLATQVARGLGMAATLIMLAAGAAALIGAALSARWALNQEEMGVLLGMLVLALASLPLALAGLVFLGTGLGAVAAFRRAKRLEQGRGPGFSTLAVLSRLFMLLGIVGVVIWAVAANQLALGAWIIGVALTIAFVVGAVTGKGA